MFQFESIIMSFPCNLKQFRIDFEIYGLESYKNKFLTGILNIRCNFISRNMFWKFFIKYRFIPSRYQWLGFNPSLQTSRQLGPKLFTCMASELLQRNQNQSQQIEYPNIYSYTYKSKLNSPLICIKIALTDFFLLQFVQMKLNLSEFQLIKNCV